MREIQTKTRWLVFTDNAYLCGMKEEDQHKNILANLGIDSLNEMQEAARHAIIKERNVVLLSPTGSGKTLAFLLPLLRLLEAGVKKVQCLIIVPSRELALQTEQVWKRMGTDFKVNVCYGGHSMDTELKNLRTPPALLIGTPGRLADLEQPMVRHPLGG